MREAAAACAVNAGVFAYVANQPLTATDPLGLDKLPPPTIHLPPLNLTCPTCPDQGFWYGTCNLCNIMGFDQDCTMDGMSASCAQAASLLAQNSVGPADFACTGFVYRTIYGGGAGGACGAAVEQMSLADEAALDEAAALWGGDDTLSPFARAVLGRVGRETNFLTQPSFYVEWFGASAAVGTAPLWGSAAGAAYSDLELAAGVAQAEQPALVQGGLYFSTGLAPGAPPAYTWGGLAAAGYQIATCPPWDGGCP
ncbi:MAG: hypothetical protein ACRD13_06700 [Terriglobales bacterium]